MVVTNTTKWAELAILWDSLADGERERLKEVAPTAVIGRDGYYTLTIAQFAQLSERGDLSAIVDAGKELTAFEYLTLEGLPEFVERYTTQLLAFVVPMSAEEKRAANACPKVGVIEGLLMFARDWFHLNYYRDAEQVTLAELLLAKKEAYSRAMFQRAYNNIMRKGKNV